MTCQEWIEDYYEHKCSKEHHSIFNGRKVFDAEKGEMSVNEIVRELGVTRRAVMFHIESGKLKTTRKGAYHVIQREDFEQFKAERYGKSVAKEA